MLLTRKRRTIKEQRDLEHMIAATEKNQAMLEYVATMADIEIPTDTDDETEGEE